MNWAEPHIRQLADGQLATFRPRGRSMEPIIRDNQLVTVRPLREGEPKVGDVVLVTVRDFTYFHLVVKIQDNTYLIGNNHGRRNGWVERAAIHGRYSEKSDE